MEELFLIIKELTVRYTGGDSTSVPIEVAEQLAEAVGYCIEEIWGDSMQLQSSGQEVRAVYEAGHQKILHKVSGAQNLYSTIMEDFDAYGNQVLRETMADGIPQFFLYYDADYNPQDHILTLDYPLLESLQELRGINRISAYLEAISLEQRFMKMFPREYVIEVLKKHNQSYRVLIINLPGILLRKVMANLLLNYPLWKMELQPQHYEELAQLIHRQGRENLELTLFHFLQSLVGDDVPLFDYLKRELANISVEFVNGAQHRCLERMV